MDFAFEELVGERVRIVPMERSHIQGLFEAGSDELIWTHLSKTMHTLEDMELIVEEALNHKANGISFPFVIMLRENNKVIGTTRFLDISTADQGLEIGWTWLTPAAWGTRINTECKYLLLKYCFESLKMIRVQFKCDNLNIQSQKAIVKIGGVKEGVLRNHKIRKNGTLRNSMVFSIIESEWESVKQNLEKKLIE